MPRAPRTVLFLAVFAVAMPLGLQARLAGAGDCFDYTTSPHWISRTPIPYPVMVAVQGNYAYVSTFDSALVVVDVADPRDPEIVARLDLEHAAGDLELAGDVLYLANDDGGLAVIDIATPSAPSLLTRVDTPGAAFQLALAGHYVYVADFSAGVQVIDVAVPAAPVNVATLAAPGFAYAVDARGPELLVGHGHGLMIADISDPLKPSQIGNLATHRIVAVAWVGDVACASAEEEGFLTVDVSAPQSPAILGRIPVPLGTWAGHITMSGATALVSVAWDGLWAIDCASPAAPQVVLDFGLGEKIGSCAVHGGQLYATDFPSALAILELGSQAPIPAGDATPRPHHGFTALRVTDSHAYALEGGWLDAFDLRSPGAPVLVSSLPVSPWARTFAVAGAFAYLGLGAPEFARGHAAWTLGGIEIVSFADRSHPDATSKLPLPQRVSAVAPGSGGVIHVLTTPAWPDTASWLHCVDVADPTAPHILGSIALPPGSWGAAYGLGRVYVYGTSLQVVDVSEPTQPHLTGSLDLGQWRYAMELVLPTTGQVQAHAYLLGSTDLAVVDLSTLDAPVLVRSVMAIGPGNLARHGHQLYAELHDAFSVYDLSDPDSPVLVGGAVGIDLVQLAAHPTTGDLVLATPFALERRPGHCGAPSRRALDTAPKASTSPALTLLTPHPNPFRSGDPPVSLEYNLPQAGPVRLAIVDAAGRCVRKLVDGSHPAGNRLVRWDGRNERGARVASGIYFIRLEAGGETRTQRLLRLR